MADGRWQGEESVLTIQCDQANNACQIKVPAPGAALVFFSDAAQAAAADGPIETFSTSIITKSKNTVTIDPSVLATSNGESGKDRLHRGGTSYGAESSGMAAYVAPGIAALISVLAGTAMFIRAS